VPLALGLLVFLGATVISGPQVLWDATRSATPLLLACAAGSFVLANAIARQDDAAMTRSRVMRGAGLTLAAVILPLAVFAAFSMGLRLNQYGLAPERLWALVAIVVACVCGVAYWVALARGRKGGWAGYVRKATFHMALVVCGLAIVLALPIFNFAAISTRNQVARLEGGKVSADDFDFAALRWDFGAPGRRALERLAKGGNARVAELAKGALAQTERVYYGYGDTVRTDADFGLRVQPEDPALRRLVLDYLKGHPWQCQERCVALDLGVVDGFRRVALVQPGQYDVIRLASAKEAVEESNMVFPGQPLREQSQVEIREVPTRFIFVDGKPVGPPLREPSTPLEASPPPR
jgi:hypothetical protein